MNRSFNRLPWLLAVTLASLTACGNLFRQPLCEYSPEHAECQGMGGAQTSTTGGTLPEPMNMQIPRTMKNQLGFSLIAESPLSATRQWVGIRQEQQLAFIERNGSDGNIKRLIITPKTNNPGFDLTEPTRDSEPPSCQVCLKMITGFDFSKDYLAASSSLFFALRPGPTGHIKAYPDGIGISSYGITDGSFLNFRPFAHPRMDVLLYQISSGQDSNQTGIALIPHPDNMRNLFASRPDNSNPPDYTSHAIGNIDNADDNFSQNILLVTQGNHLAGAYRINGNAPSYDIDNTLTNAINNHFVSNANASNNPSEANNFKIRGLFIADLNNDGYKELIYGRGSTIYIATYDLANSEKFIKWSNPIDASARLNNQPKDPSDRPRSISVADLNNDGHLDIATEIVNGNNEIPERVSIYLNNKK